MKRRTCVAMACLLVLVMLAGCGVPEASSATQDTTSIPSTTSSMPESIAAGSEDSSALLPESSESILEIAGPSNTSGILYSWKMSALDSAKENLMAWLDQMDIGTLYQDFDDDYLAGNDGAFVAEMAARGVEVLHLCGAPGWSRDPARMVEEMDKVLAFNTANSAPLKGIVFDIEPHAARGYQPSDFYAFLDTLQQAYAYAREKGLYMVVAIPYWLERVDIAVLAAIIEENSDEVSVMNYSDSTAKNLVEEILYARRQGKPINTIYEVGFGGGVAFANIEQVHADFQALMDTFEYENLRIAYHHMDAWALA